MRSPVARVSRDPADHSGLGDALPAAGRGGPVRGLDRLLAPVGDGLSVRPGVPAPRLSEPPGAPLWRGAFRRLGDRRGGDPLRRWAAALVAVGRDRRRCPARVPPARRRSQGPSTCSSSRASTASGRSSCVRSWSDRAPQPWCSSRLARLSGAEGVYGEARTASRAAPVPTRLTGRRAPPRRSRRTPRRRGQLVGSSAASQPGSVSKTGRQWWKSLWCAGNSSVSSRRGSR